MILPLFDLRLYRYCGAYGHLAGDLTSPPVDPPNNPLLHYNALCWLIGGERVTKWLLKKLLPPSYHLFELQIRKTNRKIEISMPDLEFSIDNVDFFFVSLRAKGSDLCYKTKTRNNMGILEI